MRWKLVYGENSTVVRLLNIDPEKLFYNIGEVFLKYKPTSRHLDAVSAAGWRTTRHNELTPEMKAPRRSHQHSVSRHPSRDLSSEVAVYSVEYPDAPPKADYWLILANTVRGMTDFRKPQYSAESH